MLVPYSVPHEEEQNFFLHFGSYLKNEVSYDYVAGTIMILYPYQEHMNRRSVQLQCQHFNN